MHLPVDDGLVRDDSTVHAAPQSYFDLRRFDDAGDQTLDDEGLVRLGLFACDEVPVYRARRRSKSTTGKLRWLSNCQGKPSRSLY